MANPIMAETCMLLAFIVTCPLAPNRSASASQASRATPLAHGLVVLQ
jgi:hypothetical protein